MGPWGLFWAVLLLNQPQAGNPEGNQCTVLKGKQKQKATKWPLAMRQHIGGSCPVTVTFSKLWFFQSLSAHIEIPSVWFLRDVDSLQLPLTTVELYPRWNWSCWWKWSLFNYGSMVLGKTEMGIVLNIWSLLELNPQILMQMLLSFYSGGLSHWSLAEFALRWNG